MKSNDQAKAILVLVLLLGALAVFDFADGKITGAATAEQIGENVLSITLNDDEEGNFIMRKAGAKEKDYKISVSIDETGALINVNGEQMRLLRAFNTYVFLGGYPVLAVTRLTQTEVEFTLTDVFPDVTVVDVTAIKATLSKNELGEFKIKQEYYEVSAQFPSVNKVVFSVNGVSTDELLLGGAHTFDDGVMIVVTGINRVVKSVDFVLKLTAADLTVDSITVPSLQESVVGKPITVSYVVKNIGDRDSGPYSVRIDYGDGGNVSKDYLGLRPGETQQGEQIHTYNHAYDQANLYWIEVKTDSAKDSNETNNIKRKGIRISPAIVRIPTQEFYEAQIALVDGDNLISVRESMVGKSIKKMSNDCIIKTPGWVFITRGWLTVKPSHPELPDEVYNIKEFSQEHVGLGLWLKVENAGGCTLGCGLNSCS